MKKTKAESPKGDSSNGRPYHTPVLLHTALQLLVTRPDGIYVDLTYGGGGHSRELLNILNKKGKVIAFDQDPNVPIGNLGNDSRFTFISSNFRHFHRHLHFLGISKVHGILADLGISSAQVDRNERGFSYFSDFPLDMRMNPRQNLKASDILNTWNEDELIRLFREFGEVKTTRGMVREIIRLRSLHPFESCRSFAAQIEKFAGNEKKEKFLAKVFQALRIRVNNEVDALKEMLESCRSWLFPQGRLVVISYHSLEDRMVKNLFRCGNTEGIPETDPITGKQKTFWKIITTKPVIPDSSEQKLNPRSRSAKLRAAEIIESE